MSIDNNINHNNYMDLALQCAAQCTTVPTAYNVGAVLIDISQPLSSRQLISTGYSRELQGNTHAEEVCLIKYALQQNIEHDMNNVNADNTFVDKLLSNITLPSSFVLYTTMEPCSTRLSGKQSCTELLLKTNIKTVYVACCEPKTFVENCVGIELLKQQGVNIVILDQFKQKALELAGNVT